MDGHRRTLLKTITWRIFATAITWGVVYGFNRDAILSTEITLVANGVKSLCYYVHERVWNNLSFGKR